MPHWKTYLRPVWEVARHWTLVGAVSIFVAGFVLAWWIWGGDRQAGTGQSQRPQPVSASSGSVTLWTCSMHPQIRQPSPGKCPICGMDLIPVEKATGGLRTLQLTPEAVALMSIETVPVERRYVKHSIRLVGKVDYDETALGYITAWVSGRLDRLFVDYTGVYVQKGDHMVYIYSEELYAAQEELLQALKYARSRPASPSRPGLSGVDLVASARKKLKLLGLTDEQIAEIEQQQEVSSHLTINAPVSGVVVEKLKNEGERVNLGDRIYTIADLNLVWVHLDAYESDLPWVRYGQRVLITTEAYPGEVFEGRVAFIQPVLNDETRTVKVRVNLPNKSGKFKPMMFVHATVEPLVAAGGRVIDPSLAGKWISPMHPEIIKDKPGVCDKCGMPLVRAESLGFVVPGSTNEPPPLVIPRSAALLTGTRAVVYVQLPAIHSAADPAFQTLKAVVDEGDVAKIREAFGTFGRMLDRPYDQPGTDYAVRHWEEFASRFAKIALQGTRVRSGEQAREILRQIEQVMRDVHEVFAPAGQPTFEGREIVLGPRVGKYYIVARGLEEGELVVSQGNFKIDAEIQIQAKPSMMTPDGGGGGGHQHGEMKRSKDGAMAKHEGPHLPQAFLRQWHELEQGYASISRAMEAADLQQARRAFGEFAQLLSKVDATALEGQVRAAWKEASMLLGNDAFEGSQAATLPQLDRTFLLLKDHMRRARQLLGTHRPVKRHVETLEVPLAFQQQLMRVWQAYLSLESALARDDATKAKLILPQLKQALQSIQADDLEGAAADFWKQERDNLAKILDDLGRATDLKALRQAFKPLSEEIGVLARAIGFGPDQVVVELHCPMAFGGQGAVWYQQDKTVRNPYYGAQMLECADRVEKLAPIAPVQTP